MRARFYQSDVAILKKYSYKKLKLTLHSTLRVKGYEGSKRFKKKGTVNTEKLDENIIRARSTIFELAYCNEWEYFSTFTLDKEKFNRYDLENYQISFSRFIRDYNAKHGLKIKYLTIPECHKDGAWHLHGFIMGLPRSHLRAFTIEEKLPYHIRDKLLNDELVYEWPPYREKFGWVNFEQIRSHEAVSKYVTKYISKSLATSVKAINAHLYYCSKGLKRAEEIKRGILSESIPFDYENEYVKIAWLSDQPSALNLIR